MGLNNFFGASFAFAFLLSGHSALAAAPLPPPNIVLILVDDLPWYGTSVRMEANNAASKTSHVVTPNIDRLSSGGMTFSHAYAAASICGPSRANLQLGTTALRSRYTANSGSGQGDESPGIDYKNSGFLLNEPRSLINLPSDRVTLAERLKARGYQTAHFGKWHVWGNGPQAHGFDVSDGNTSNDEGSTGGPKDPKHMFGITQSAIDFMKQQVNVRKPFFVQLSHYVAHKGYSALPETITKYKRQVDGGIGDQLGLKSDRERLDYATLLAMMDNFDGTVGNLMTSIQQMGIENNTYIVFTSDNGYAWPSNTNELRGEKWWLFESGLRVPLIVKGPRIAPASRSDTNVALYDLYPTFVNWAGGDPASLQNIDGVSLKNHMEQPSSAALARRNLYFHYPHARSSTPQSAVINDERKLLMFHEHLIASNRRDKGYFLFDLHRSSGDKPFRGQREQSNLFTNSSVTAYEMEQQFHQYLQSVSANPNYSLPTKNSAASSNLVPINVDQVMPPRSAAN